jgi:hypothetical protein
MPGPDGIDGIIVKRLPKCLPKFWISLFTNALYWVVFERMEKGKGDSHTQIGQDQTPLRIRIPEHKLAVNSRKIFRKFSD